MDDLTIEPGTPADYRRLAKFHYKPGHPGAVTSVLRITRRGLTVVGRFLQRREETQIAGVLVRSLPPLACRSRDLATGNRYGGLCPHDAALTLNRQVRTISRVVIDPPWRGMGLAVRLVRFALHHPEPEIYLTEALAAMGRESPFFEHAGMMRYDRPPTPYAARLLDALEHLSIAPVLLASPGLITAQVDQWDDSRRRWLDTELRRWHRAAHRVPASTLASMTMNDLLLAAQRKVLAQPVYYAFHHERESQSGSSPCTHPTHSKFVQMLN